MAGKQTFYYNNSNETSNIQSKWWDDFSNGKILPGERHKHIWQVINGIRQFQSYRYNNYLRFAKLYCNMDLQGLDAGLYARVQNQDAFLSHRVTLNVIKSCIDTAQSKIGKSRPRPLFLTEDGNWGEQQRAKYLTMYMDGWFDYAKIYQKTPKMFRDAGIFGKGVLKLCIIDGQVHGERILTNELVIDEVEGMYGEPRQIHQQKNMFREVLADLYPEHAKEIYAAPNCIEKQFSTSYAADMVKVTESWHLPSGLDAKDGRHSITIPNCDLLEQNYTKDYFPFVFFDWSEPVVGFYGYGLAEELIGIQLEINKILRNIQLAQHLIAVPQVWVEGNSKVVSAHINNQMGGIKRYFGTPPIFMNPTAMGPEIYQYLQTLYQRAFEITGISQMSAQSQKPAGLDAAVALREMQNIETERFMNVAQRYEDMHLEIARMAIRMTKDLYEGDSEAGLEPTKDLAINAVDKEFMRKIKWKDVHLDEDKYVIRCFPTNLLPTTPAGKLETVQELMQAGLLEREDGISLLDFPDTKAVTGRMTAARDDVLRLIYLMLEEGKYFTPEPYMNLDLAKKLTQSEYNKARTQDAPEDRLELLRRFMDEADAMMQQAVQEQQQQQMQAQMAAQGAQGQMSPQGVPAAPPVSQLLPNQA